ncbi:argonaute-like protein [Abortiporus biennis]|nr:argonaute-like protein [Abortiporus biennis]
MAQRGGRGRGRGNAPAIRGRGGGPIIGGASRPAAGLPESHVTTIGCRRPGFGSSGTAAQVFTNCYATSIPDSTIYHYDIAITPSEQTLPAKLCMDLIRHLQEVDHPDIFNPKAVYDGRKNMFSCTKFNIPETGQTFDVTLAEPRTQPPREGARGPKIYKIKVVKVAEINAEVLNRFIAGKQSHDNTVLTAITALNVVVRMEPTIHYPFNVRSFFTDKETKDIGSGLVLWRGYFQSVRPTIGKMLINIDISTGTMYKPGPLINLCLDFFNRPPSDAPALAPSRGFDNEKRLRLQRFISGMRVVTTLANPSQNRRPTPRVVKRISEVGATNLTFNLDGVGTISVAQYFQTTHNRPLSYPQLPCVEVGNGALIPLEMCRVPPGQIMRKQVPPERTKDVLEFATKKPHDRLASIKNGLGVLAYGQSEYVRQFGMHVQDTGNPLLINARVLQPPVLRYHQSSKQATITPRDGAWNMIDKKFFKAATIERWVFVIYEREQRFNMRAVQDMVQGLMDACAACGIQVQERDPIIQWKNPQGVVHKQLVEAGQDSSRKNGNKMPRIIVVVLPEGANDIYTAVKHFGDVKIGVATQCMKSMKCNRAKQQYFANICLKINVKLGGINTIPDPRSTGIQALTDPHNPTIVMGADVIHPAAHSDGRPSFTALVGNVDSETAKYIADCRVQASRQEMIDDLQSMAEGILTKYMGYRESVEKKPNKAPKRIIFYRDGVSEGQFKQVLELELPQLQAACKKLGINPKITLIVVGKRHHVRFFPKMANEGDRSGNCRAGTVVDSDIVHPTEFDFYLQSHAGLLGTSRPAHYNILHDENNFTPDNLQALSFALCHVYARSTRSVSIPAPVYYADIVCSRAKNHYDPEQRLDFSEMTTADEEHARQQLKVFKDAFKPLHHNMKTLMYFS